MSLKQISEQVLVFNTPEEARKTLGKRKPVIWIVADETVKKKASSWKESGLKQISEQVLVFNTPEEARKTLGKRKPVIWIVADETVKKKASSWKESGNRPVILLTKHTSKISLTEENKGKLRMLRLPVMPEDLRNAVNACLR